MNANELKNRAAQARRTSTALTMLSMRLDLQEDDKMTLERAAVILATVGSKVKRDAEVAKRKEVEMEKAIAVATVEVKRFIATWPAETLLDKTAIMCASSIGRYCLPLHLKERDEKEIVWYLNTTFNDSIREITESAAYRSVVDGKPVNVVMEFARQQLDKYRVSQMVQVLAKQWEEKLIEVKS